MQSSDRRRRRITLLSAATSSLTAFPAATIALVLGVAVATAVIVGALLVGDSMRGSLRRLTMERIGRIETLVAPGRFFDVDSKTVAGEAEAVILLPGGTAEFTQRVDGDSDQTSRTRYGGSVQVIGVDPTFWQLNLRPFESEPPGLGESDVIINAELARELGVVVGDSITIRLPVQSAVPADSPLGRREIRSEGLPRMTVVAIEDRGIANFSITPNQSAPRNAFLARSVIADLLERDGQANALLIAESMSTIDPQRFDLQLADLGVQFDAVAQTFNGEVVFQYASLSSEQLLLPPAVVEILTGEDSAGSLPRPEMTLAYLANAIARIGDDGVPGPNVPYSIVVAAEDADDLPLPFDAPEAAGLPVVINDWTARQIGASVGDAVRLFYFEPEVQSGQEIERSVDGVISGVVPITEPSRPYGRRRDAVFADRPTRYNDPNLTPTVPGVTDQDSINDWDLPFELTREISRADDDYWRDYRLTPKAFVPLAAGRRLFGSRFGEVTSLRYPNVAPEAIRELRGRVLDRLLPYADRLGWQPVAIGRQQLSAASGTTPFDGLFLALSFFVIAASVLLILLLSRLGLENRRGQIATLAAVGWSGRRIGRLLLIETWLTSMAGGVVGIGLGIGYAWWLIDGLRTRWAGAVGAAGQSDGASFLELVVTPRACAIGGLIGVAMAVGLVWLSVRGMTAMRPAELLRGGNGSTPISSGTSVEGLQSVFRPLQWFGSLPWFGVLPWASRGLVVLAAMLMIAAVPAGGMTMAGLFVAAGMVLLVACLLRIYRSLAGRGPGSSRSLWSLAAGAASRNPVRSTLAIGLMAVASFLVVSMSAFRLSPTDRGIGGFDYLAVTSSPIYRDLSDATVRSNLIGGEAKPLIDATIEPMRMRVGQDASCNNLYRSAAPTVLGVRQSMMASVADRDFDWAGHDRLADDSASPWGVLRFDGGAAGTADDPVPVVIDQNTAMWSLGLTGGVGQIATFTFDDREVVFRVAGLLAGSVLQGQLMISESSFERLFPNISGYQYFLIRSDAADVPEILESRLSDVGMDVRESRRVLAGLLAVQNTYLSTFQTLGGLGLLLGTIGLAVASLRSVLSRRGELAVMRAIGFGRGRLSAMVLAETSMLLVAGIAAGVGCAAVALLPSILQRGDASWVGPLVTIAMVTVFGLAAGLLAVAKVARMPLLDSLRSDF